MAFRGEGWRWGSVALLPGRAISACCKHKAPPRGDPAALQEQETLLASARAERQEGKLLSLGGGWEKWGILEALLEELPRFALPWSTRTKGIFTST